MDSGGRRGQQRLLRRLCGDGDGGRRLEAKDDYLLSESALIIAIGGR